MADIQALRQRLRDPKTPDSQKVRIRNRIKFLKSNVKKANKQVTRERRGEGVLKDARQAQKTAEKVLPLDPLGRVDEARSEEVQDVLDQERALSDPFSDAYVGNRSGQLKDFMNRYEDSTQGYDTKELNALREARRRETDRGFQSGRAALMRGQNAVRLGSTQRAAQLAELAKTYGQQSTDAENDIFLRSADEKQRRLEGYGNTLQGVEASEFDKANQALANYKATLGGAEANELDRAKINLGQEAADRAAKVGGVMGILGIQEARRNAEQQNKLIREGYASNERIAGKSSSGSSGGSNAYADELEKLAEELAARGV